jgi:hypothetical protein
MGGISMIHRKRQAGASQIVPLAVMAVILLVGYVALDRYTSGQKDMVIVESRGMNMIAALGSFKRETGNYPDSLSKLVPKFATRISRCPDGQPIGYLLSAGEYVLSCHNVVFKQRPYNYDSRSKSWND